MGAEVTAAVKQAVETTTLPAGIAVSTFTFFGVPLSDWVFVGTAFLLACNLIITVPKAYRFIKGALTSNAEPKGGKQ